VRRQGIKLKLD
jgi:hypothetical protein